MPPRISEADLANAFASIRKWDMTVNNVGCSVCGHMYVAGTGEPCEHLAELFEDILEDKTPNLKRSRYDMALQK